MNSAPSSIAAPATCCVRMRPPDSLLRLDYQYPQTGLCQRPRCRQASHPRADYHNVICFTCHSRLDA